MNICLVNKYYYPNEIGGAEVSLRFLAEELVKNGHTVSVLSLNEHDTSIMTYNGVKIFRIKLKNIFWIDHHNKLLSPIWHLIDIKNYMMKQAIEAFFDNENFDIVHTNNIGGFSTIIWEISKKRNINVVHTLRDYYLLCPRATMFRGGKNCDEVCFSCSLYAIPKKIISNNVNSVVGNSEFILNKHLNNDFFTSSAIKTVIYNGYEPELVDKDTRIQKKHEHIQFGFIGRIQKSKGIEYLMDEISICTLQHIQFTVVVAGKVSNGYKDMLQKKYKEIDIVFLGKVQKELFYQSVDFVVLPSLWHEPLSRVIFESYAHGLPVIATNTGGSKEVVNDGESGYVINPNNKGELADAIKKMLTKLKENPFHFKDTCLKKAKVFSLKNLYNNYLKIYEKSFHK